MKISSISGLSLMMFDVSTAFLSGDATSRQIFVRAPNEGLPAAAGETAVPGGTLFQILKSAYSIPTLLAMVFRGGVKNVSYNFVGTPHRGKIL